MLRKFESLEVKDGKIILKVRAKGGASRGRPPRPTEVESPVERQMTAPPQESGAAPGPETRTETS